MESMLKDLYYASPAVAILAAVLLWARQLLNRLFNVTIPRLADTFEKRSERQEDLFVEQMRLHREEMLRREEMFIAALDKIEVRFVEELKSQRTEIVPRLEAIREKMK